MKRRKGCGPVSPLTSCLLLRDRACGGAVWGNPRNLRNPSHRSIGDQLDVEPTPHCLGVFSQGLDFWRVVAVGRLQAGDRRCLCAHLFGDLTLRQASAFSRFEHLVQQFKLRLLSLVLGSCCGVCECSSFQFFVTDHFFRFFGYADG